MPVEEFDESIYRKPSSKEEISNSNTESDSSRGSNLRIRMRLTSDEMSKGTTKFVKIKRLIACNECQGAGYKKEENKFSFLPKKETVCDSCQGEGRVMSEETIEVAIPKGVEVGMQLNLEGKGNAGIRGGATGSLLIIFEHAALNEIKQEVPNELQREGLNVAYQLHITFPEAVFGVTVEVPTINGKAKIKVPAGTQGGKIFRLKGKGYPAVQSDQLGDQLIIVNIWTPQNLTDEQRQALEQMNESVNFKPQPGKSEKTFFEKVREIFL